MKFCPTCNHRVRRQLALRCDFCGKYVRLWLVAAYVVGAVALYVTFLWLHEFVEAAQEKKKRVSPSHKARR